jgi:hypothetical protein
MKRFTPYEQWHCELVSSGAFDHLNKLFKLNEQLDWPSCSWFDGFLNATNANNRPIVFKEDGFFNEEERYYEQIIYDTGFVPTRQQNWHDLFGGFIWCLFPKTKSLLNKRHVQEINLHGTKQRSKHRNALTLFDECGVILAISDDKWPARLRNHQWQEAFVDLRDEWGKSISPFMFGHANYEMLTKPYIGLTGKALFVKVPDDTFCKDLVAQYAYLDTVLYEMIENNGCLQDNSLLSPLPLLGVQGWHDDNKNSEFYSNTDYFRPKRRKR